MDKKAYPMFAGLTRRHIETLYGRKGLIILSKNLFDCWDFMFGFEMELMKWRQEFSCFRFCLVFYGNLYQMYNLNNFLLSVIELYCFLVWRAFSSFKDNVNLSGFNFVNFNFSVLCLSILFYCNTMIWDHIKIIT